MLPFSSRWCSRKVRDLWWQGIPPSVRGKVWSLAIGNELNITHGEWLAWSSARGAYPRSRGVFHPVCPVRKKGSRCHEAVSFERPVCPLGSGGVGTGVSPWVPQSSGGSEPTPASLLSPPPSLTHGVGHLWAESRRDLSSSPVESKP